MADYMTLEEARDWAEFLVDDTSNKRFSTAQVDFALKSAVASTIDDICNKGLTHFVRYYSGTTDTNGQLDLSSLEIKTIFGVQYYSDSNYYLLKPIDHYKKTRLDKTARSIEIAYVPRHTFPTNTAHPLVGNGATSLRSWRAFDELCCATAAQTLLVRNGEVNPALERKINRLEKSVLQMSDSPRWASPNKTSMWFGDWLMWSYTPEDQTVQLLLDVTRS